MFALSDYAYDLPESLIADQPEKARDASRLLCLDRQSGTLAHRVFADVEKRLAPGDLLVMNNTRVVPARLYGAKDTGGRVEILLLDYVGGMARHRAGEPFECECLIRASKHPKPGSRIHVGPDVTAEVVASTRNIHTLRFHGTSDFDQLLDALGRMPLPPYIKRDDQDARSAEDKQRYQTVYASEKGAVAAPTAGLHFTDDLLARIRARGVETVPVTLHVGYGTFVPVRADDIREHQIHSERYHIPDDSARAINRAKQDGRRIVAVGTTTVRTLEYAARQNGVVQAGVGVCDLFIYPGYTFRVIDAMITNFHIPESTLLMLVSAFAGREQVLAAYREAVRERYRFYSYGDAMMIA